MDAPGVIPVRRKFVSGGREVYEWDQSLDEVNVYITPPAGVTASMLDCTITAHRIKLGLKGNPPFLDVRSRTARRRNYWTHWTQYNLTNIAFLGPLFLTLVLL